MSLTLIFVATAIRLEFAADIVPLHDDIELLVMFLLHVFLLHQCASMISFYATMDTG